MERFKGLLLDMDGVLVDSMPLHFQVWREFKAQRGLDIPDAELRHLVDARRNVEIFPALLGRKISDVELGELARQKEDNYLKLAKVKLLEVAGARAFLERAKLAKIPLGLATAASGGNVSLVLQTMGFGRYFDTVLTAADVAKGKPDPEVYLRTAATLGLVPGACLVIEDALLGVQSAKAAGCLCLGLKTAHEENALKNAGADWVCSTFKDLPRELETAIFG